VLYFPLGQTEVYWIPVGSTLGSGGPPINLNCACAALTAPIFYCNSRISTWRPHFHSPFPRNQENQSLQAIRDSVSNLFSLTPIFLFDHTITDGQLDGGGWSGRWLFNQATRAMNTSSPLLYPIGSGWAERTPRIQPPCANKRQAYLPILRASCLTLPSHTNLLTAHSFVSLARSYLR
jgi:hypothetical protein